MSLKSSLRNRLIADVTLNGLVSNRIFPQFAPSSVVSPYIAFDRDSKEVIENLSNISDIQKETYGFFVYGDTPLQVENIKNALVTAMSLLNRITFEAIDYLRAFQSAEIDDFIDKGIGDETPIFSETLAFIIWFR